MPVSGMASSLTKSYKALSTLSSSTLTVSGIAQILKSGPNTNAAGVADPNQWQSGAKWRDRIASRYLGSGMDCARSASNSPYQSSPPAGSIEVGTASPSFSTVTAAVSPLTVTMPNLPASFSVRNSLPLAARIPSGPLIGLSSQMSMGLPA